jgi:hypothetical protein
MATKGSGPARPRDPGRSDLIRGRDGGVKMAQSGGVSKGTPSRPRDPGGVAETASKGTGLQVAWADQTKYPSKLNNLGPAKTKVR